MALQKFPVYCYQCVAGPDLLKVVVEDGVATKVEPNFDMAAKHPGGGRICVKAYGLIQKTYNPHRIKAPMRRTNPRKGKHEDPGWVEMGWDEALDLVAERLIAIRRKGLLDESGYPRLAATFGGAGSAVAYLGTFPAFLAAWGPVDMGLGSGQGVKCYHSEHLYGEFWHRAFTVVPDTPLCKYVISFGNNTEASGGVTGIWRHAEARARGLKRIQVEPHLSITGAASAEWVPIKPKTDAAFLFGMLHAVLHRHEWRKVCDLDFLRIRTNAPYLVGPNGYYIRDPESKKPLVWDGAEGRAKVFDDQSITEHALEGEYEVRGVEVGPNGTSRSYDAVSATPAFQKLIEHVKEYTPEWAAGISDVPPQTIERLANAFLSYAQVGATIEIDGRTLPYRPVAIVLGKTVANGWGGFECCWARTVLACLVGALEVPGSILGTTVRLNRPATNRLDSVTIGPDGFMGYPLNPTDREKWNPNPHIRSAYKTLVPLAADSPWSAALSPAHLPWLFMMDPPKNWPTPTLPDLWFVYRTNPAISLWQNEDVANLMARFPFTVAIAYTQDETNWFADVLLPESTDLESLQLYRLGGTKYIEQYWEHAGFALRQPTTIPPYNTRDLTEIATELATRTGLLQKYHEAINKGGGVGVSLRSEKWDFSLEPGVKHSTETIWDRACKAATASLTDGAVVQDLEWFREHGAFFVPFSKLQWYLYPVLVDMGLRFEIPYQERLKRIGAELGERLHEQGITWWETQLKEYQALPVWTDFPDIWARAAALFGKSPEAFPFWLLTSRSMQYAWGANVGIPVIADVATNVAGHFGLIINSGTAKRMGIGEGDLLIIESPVGTTKGRAVLRQGIRPDVLLAVGQFDHWATPVAKELGMPSLNTLAPMHLDLTDATGSGADLVRVSIKKA